MSIVSSIRSGLLSGVRSGVNVPATLSTLDLSTPVTTIAGMSESQWTATLTWRVVGAAGNGGVLDLAFRDADPASVEVRDHQRYNGVSWETAPNTVGCLVLFSAGIDEITVGEIESAIAAESELAQVTTPDPTPTKMVSAEMDSVVTQGTFSGGVG